MWHDCCLRGGVEKCYKTDMSDDQQQPPAETPAEPAAPQTPATQQQIPGADKKVLAGILGIVLGAFGIHKFVLGYQKEGIIMLVITLVTCGFGATATSIIGIVEGIMYLTKSDEEFVNTYITNQKPWF